MPIRPGDARALTEMLVRIDSRNPTLVPGAPGESGCAHVLAEVLGGWGFRLEWQEVRELPSSERQAGGFGHTDKK